MLDSKIKFLIHCWRFRVRDRDGATIVIWPVSDHTFCLRDSKFLCVLLRYFWPRWQYSVFKLLQGSIEWWSEIFFDVSFVWTARKLVVLVQIHTGLDSSEAQKWWPSVIILDKNHEHKSRRTGQPAAKSLCDIRAFLWRQVGYQENSVAERL